MSGTSLDGIDVALAQADGDQFRLVGQHFQAYPEAVKSQLLALHSPTANEIETAQVVANQLARLYAQGVNDLLKKQSLVASDIMAIGCHGQTIRHCPQMLDGTGFTLQIGNHALLAELTNISVVGDFRSRDIAAGGQGAPLVPAFHQAVFGSNQKNRAIVNIGGIANITYLPTHGEVLGFDSGPGNMLMDSWTKLKTGKDYDANGAWAATGVVHQSFLDNMLAEPYFALPPPKSTGRDLFNDAWLKQHLLYPHCRPQDIVCTLTALTAQSIYNALATYCPKLDEVYLCGGGAHNDWLVKQLSSLLSPPHVAHTDALGVNADWVEAVAFAWLAKQTLHNKPSNLPAVTGAQGLRVLGAIYPA